MKFSLCALLLFFALNVVASDAYINKVVDAIYLAEGGAKTKHPFGIIKSTGGSNECRRICFNTVKRCYTEWQSSGSSEDFIQVLGKTYAPTTGKITDRERELNQYWVKNVSYFVRKVGK